MLIRLQHKIKIWMCAAGMDFGCSVFGVVISQKSRKSRLDYSLVVVGTTSYYGTGSYLVDCSTVATTTTIAHSLLPGTTSGHNNDDLQRHNWFCFFETLKSWYQNSFIFFVISEFLFENAANCTIVITTLLKKCLKSWNLDFRVPFWKMKCYY